MTSRPAQAEDDERGGPFVQFTLLEGPINHLTDRFAAWLGPVGFLVTGYSFSILLWLVLAAIAAAEGMFGLFFSLDLIAVHVRMLLAIPLVVLCARLLDSAIRDACGMLVTTGIVAGEAKAALDIDADRIARIRRSTSPELVLLALVILFSIAVPRDFLPSVSGLAKGAVEGQMSLTERWDTLVCLTAFRFFMARFLMLLLLWFFLIWRISRQNLALSAPHPDRAGGLGLLEVAQAQLVVLVVALGTINAAALAEASQHAALTDEVIYARALMVAVIGWALVCLPLLPLFPQLLRCRRRGMTDFGILSREYTMRFSQRWSGPPRPDYGDLLGSADIQSLADLYNGYQNVRGMRILPVNQTLLIAVFFCAAVPHLPLFLINYPVTDLISDLARAIMGV